MMRFRKLSSLLVLSAACGLLSYGCGGSSDEGGSGPSGPDDGFDPNDPTVGRTDALSLHFAPDMYSAYDGGENDYQIPATVTGVMGEVEWHADPPDAVRFEPYEEAEGSAILITTQAAGDVVITATVGNLYGQSTLHITQADTETWARGNLRYNNGTPAQDPNVDLAALFSQRFAELQAMGVDLLNTPPEDLAMYFSDIQVVDNQSDCGNCHDPNATGVNGESPFGMFGEIDVEHTPQQTGGYSDQELINIFTMGQKPEGVGMRSNIPADIWQRLHRWDMAEEDKMGIVFYLRSLPPRTQGEIDFGFGGFGG